MSSNNKKYRLRKRAFLSRAVDSADFVIGVVEDTKFIPDDEENDSWKWAEINLTVGTDYDRISLNFSMETHEDRADSLYKIRQLVKAVCQFRDALEAEVKSMNARKSQRQLRRAESNVIEFPTVA